MRTITGIHGVPRSGTSWLAQIFNASPDVSLKFQPLFSYAFKNALNEYSNAKDVSTFFKEIYHSDDDFINMRDTNLLKAYPTFIKNKNRPHLVFKHVRYHFVLPNLIQQNSKLKLILVIRNPLSVLSSWKNAPREFNNEWNFIEEWQNASKKNVDKADYFGYDKWKNATQLFLNLKKEYPERVELVDYKFLLKNTLTAAESLLEFSGIKMDEQIINFIKASKSKHVYDSNSVYKIKIDDKAFENDLPIEIQDAVFNDLNGTNLEKYLY